ncbi:ROK family protein [candidate division KSB3 bacterium]|uniref:ROK family protein n=1 Tax=candidate division KSB3 bacterium TaxID=2044937 RepID=A0A9D5JV24_9BACT|nr:ROK family protein [candidate division KSB3 bacterium]MBD3324789.1 ROK family protein [candidate division KSB3 bacterium]
MEYYAGIDVGGTKIYAVVINPDGEILGRAKLKTGKDRDFEPVFERILACYQTASENAKITAADIGAIGLAVPSSIDRERGTILHAPNLGWENLDAIDTIKTQFGKPVFLDNDVNMGVFGEYHFGAGKGYKSIYGMFVGTGIGGGYVFEGQVIRGVSYTGGEVGHMIIKMGGPRCNCRNKGCLEAIAAKAGMIKYMKKQVDKKGKKTVLDKLAPNWRTTVGSSALRKAFHKEDKVVLKALKRSAKAIGVAAANLISVVGIEAIIIGGGVIEELSDFFMPIIRESMEKHAFAGGAQGVDLLESTLGDDAVALGAAWFVRLPEKQHLIFR